MCGGSGKAQRQMMQLMMIQQAQQAAEQRKMAEDAARKEAEVRAGEKAEQKAEVIAERGRSSSALATRGGKGRRSLMRSANSGFVGRFG